MVANINMDMFLPLFPMQRLMVLGLDESDLGDDVRAVAQEMNIVTQGDPQPQRNRFIRSDQYSFIREGVPALAMKVGFEPGSPEEKIDAAWTRERYHAPSDDLAQPIDRSAAVAFTDLIGRLSVRVASRRQYGESSTVRSVLASSGEGAWRCRLSNTRYSASLTRSGNASSTRGTGSKIRAGAGRRA
jgi:Zn-dependent M28 family amino/carboxypeptidase